MSQTAFYLSRTNENETKNKFISQQIGSSKYNTGLKQKKMIWLYQLGLQFYIVSDI